MLILLILFGKILQVFSGTCSKFKTPGIGREVAGYRMEVQCAMHCYSQQDCSRYMYHEQDKRCIILNVFDVSFMAEDFMNSDSYVGFKKQVFHNT